MKQYLKWIVLFLLAAAIFLIMRNPFGASSTDQEAAAKDPDQVISDAAGTGTPVFLYFFGQY